MEALQLLAHEGLVVITPPYEHGIYVSYVHLVTLDQLSEMRVRLEALAARLAAQRATADDLAVMDALLAEYTAVPADDIRRTLEVDHRLHQAIALAAGNRYLAATLDDYFGLSQRLWYLVFPHISMVSVLSDAVEMHSGLLQAILSRDSDGAERIMRQHVSHFYEQVRSQLTAQVTVHLGNDERTIKVDEGSLLGGAVIAAGFPLNQYGRGKKAQIPQVDAPTEVE
jgi:DNA-binding GntR family transcriptional regulator